MFAQLSLDQDDPQERMHAFLDMRYTVMSCLFPHEPFSVSEATFDFFDDTISYLVNGIPQVRPGGKPEDAKHDIYWQRYRDWMKRHA